MAQMLRILTLTLKVHKFTAVLQW